MMNKTIFAAILVLGFSLSQGFASDASKIETRIIECGKGKKPFPAKAFSFLLEKEKLKSGTNPANPSYVAGILTAGQMGKLKGLGKSLPDITLPSGQKGTVQLTWNEKVASGKTAEEKVGMACTYRPVSRNGGIRLNIDYHERLFLGLINPAELAKNTKKSDKLSKRAAVECNEKSCKPIAAFAMKQLTADVQLYDGQTLVAYLDKTANGGRRYLFVTVHKVPGATSH